MKTLNYESQIENFADFTLSVDEMLKVKGGNDPHDPTVGDPTPPIIIKL